jgi:hypothetical protein
MQSGKHLTLKDYFAKHTRTHKNHKNTNIELLLTSCQLSSSVIFREYRISQSECKIDRPRPGLPRVSPRPHTEALGTRLMLNSWICHLFGMILLVSVCPFHLWWKWTLYISHRPCISRLIMEFWMDEYYWLKFNDVIWRHN